ncbi:MAG: WD40 repeat domain-containing protein [Anaerolineae bacterium]|nr:WD40 repeat domain-containing protein [Anaerolineae bacterium]
MRFQRWLIWLSVLVLVVAACGKDGDKDSDEAKSTPEPQFNWQEVTSIDVGETSVAALSPDRTRMATAAGQDVKVWDVTTGERIGIISGNTGRLTALAWADNNLWLATGDDGHVVTIWDTESKLQIAKVEGMDGTINALAWLGHDYLAAAAGLEGSVTLFSITQGRALAKSIVMFPQALAWRMMHLTIGSSGKVYFQELDFDLIYGSGMNITMPPEDTAITVGDPEQPRGVSAVAWSTTSTIRLATGGNDNTVRVWNTGARDEPLLTLEGHSSTIMALAWSPGDTRLASGDAEGAIRIWDTENGRLLFTIDTHTDAILALGWAAEDAHLISASADGTIRVWEETEM